MIEKLFYIIIVLFILFTITTISASDKLSSSNNDIYFNFTVSDSDGIDTCELWGNWTSIWHKNLTKQFLGDIDVNASEGFFVQNISDGFYRWNIWCNDTLGNEDFAFQNNTINVDGTYPTVSIDEISVIKTYNITYFAISTIEANPLSCKFSVYDINGLIDGLNENISLPSCNYLGFAQLSSVLEFTVKIYITDIFGNENSTTKLYTEILPIIITEPGGAIKEIINNIQVYAIRIPSNITRKFTDLERARIYKLFYDYYNSTIKSFSTVLEESEILILQGKIRDMNIVLTLDELKMILYEFNKGNVDVVDIQKVFVDRYGLIATKIEFKETTFKIFPNRLDTFFLVFGSKRYEYNVNSNKILKNFSIVSGNITVEITGPSTAKIIYELDTFPPDFMTKVVTGKINFIDKDGNSFTQELTIRVINVKSFIPIGLILIPLIGLSVFIYRKGYIPMAWKKR